MKRYKKSRLFALTVMSIIVIVVFLFLTTALSQNPDWINFTLKNTWMLDA